MSYLPFVTFGLATKWFLWNSSLYLKAGLGPQYECISTIWTTQYLFLLLSCQNDTLVIWTLPPPPQCYLNYFAGLDPEFQVKVVNRINDLANSKQGWIYPTQILRGYAWSASMNMYLYFVLICLCIGHVFFYQRFWKQLK